MESPMRRFARLDWTATTFDPETFTEPVEMAELHVRYRARFGGRPCHSNASICTLINRAEASSSRDARFNMKIRRAVEHRDSMGNGSVIRPGEVQRMTAGTGVMHSEFNHSDSELLHLLQIWILPERAGLTRGYEKKAFGEEIGSGKLLLIGSNARGRRAPDGSTHRLQPGACDRPPDASGGLCTDRCVRRYFARYSSRSLIVTPNSLGRPTTPWSMPARTAGNPPCR